MSPLICYTTHPDLATVTPTTPIALPRVSTVPVHLPTLDTQHNDIPMGDKHPSQVNDDNMMEQEITTIVPPILQPAQHPPSTSTMQMRPLPLPLTTETYLSQILNTQFIELSDKVVGPALSKAIDAMILAMIERITGEIRGLSTCSHHPPALKQHVEEDD